MKGVFVTGTDTGVGKTRVSCAVVAALNAQGLRTAVMKPVASGCIETPEGLRNDDALQLMAVASVEQDYAEVNPYALLPPIAPHIAAAQAGVEIDLAQVESRLHAVHNRADVCVVEGVGGWCVPLSATATTEDLALRLQLPVVVVVGLRLGCINHALLTVAAVRTSGLPLLGWVANQVTPAMDCLEENIHALQLRIDAPLLGVLSYSPHATPIQLASHLHITI